MPTYLYRCGNESCCEEFETIRSIKSDYLVTCPKCNRDTLNVVIHAAHAFVRGEPKTIGMLADRNTAAMSNAQKSELYAKQEHDRIAAKRHMNQEIEARLPEGASIPKYDPHSVEPIDMSLASLTPKQVKKYVEEGVKP